MLCLNRSLVGITLKHMTPVLIRSSITSLLLWTVDFTFKYKIAASIAHAAWIKVKFLNIMVFAILIFVYFHIIRKVSIILDIYSYILMLIWWNNQSLGLLIVVLLILAPKT
jgi:hypothetical protein